jgi:hypothetical protein
MVSIRFMAVSLVAALQQRPFYADGTGKMPKGWAADYPPGSRYNVRF